MQTLHLAPASNFTCYRVETAVLNSAPKSLEQEMPKKLRELMKSQELMAADAQLSKRRKKTARSGKIESTLLNAN